MRTATIRTSSTGGIELLTQYDADFVTELKVTIPPFARKWVPDRKVWTVTEAYATAAVQLLHQYFTVIDLREDKTKEQREQRERQQQEQQRQQQQERERRSSYGHSPYAALHLQPTAPPELIHSAWRCLAKLYHPDRGGDLTMMQRINRAYEELKPR
jgi:hypothetical protein